MTRDFGQFVRSGLGPQAEPMSDVEMIGLAQHHCRDFMSIMEPALGNAGFYGADAEPYPDPTTPIAAPVPKPAPTVQAVRDLWISRWNPSDERFREGDDSTSDVEDPAAFPWNHPELAMEDGWWITTERWPDGQNMLYPNVGDLLVVQRQRPERDRRRADVAVDASRTYVGLAAVVATVAGPDDYTGRYETQACVMPLHHFTDPVDLDIAKRKFHRLKSDTFTKLPAKADGSGFNRQITPLTGADAIDVLSVCGLSPEILAEEDLATIAARLAATEHTGNPEYLKLRYDHQIRQAARRANELRAEEAAKVWAKESGYVFVSRDALTPLLGYDLLFRDGNDDELQVEVKGYSTDKLAEVHLQPSQIQRATSAASGSPPDWRLYVMLRAATKRPDERVCLPKEVLDLLARGELSARSS